MFGSLFGETHLGQRSSAAPKAGHMTALVPRARSRRTPCAPGAVHTCTNAVCVQTIETAIGRYKHLIDPKLRARNLPGQQGEVALAVQALNRMIRIAKPISVRVA